MPVNSTLAKSLKRQYGSKEGERVYFAMENSGKPSFTKGLKTATKEGHTVKHMQELGKTKAPPKHKESQNVSRRRVGIGADDKGRIVVGMAPADVGVGADGKEKWIQKARAGMKAKGTEGAFSAKAARAGKSTKAFAAQVLKPGSKASAETRKQANFARNVGKGADPAPKSHAAVTKIKDPAARTAADHAYDRAHGIKQGSKRDLALDRKAGLKEHGLAEAKASGSPIPPQVIAKAAGPKLARHAPPAALRSTKKGDAIDRRMGMPAGSKSRRERA